MAFLRKTKRRRALEQDLQRIADERDEAVRERDEARQQRDEAREQLFALNPDARHLVFYHIPRTGGSSIWHALAGSAASIKVPIVDLFYLSQLDYGSTEYALNVLADHRELLKRCETLIHLHTPQNISCFLREDRIVYATIVRDPIERFCSDVAHLHQVLPNFTQAAQNDFLERARWAPRFVDAMTDVEVSTDTLLEMAAEEPFFRYYYYHHFYGLLCEKPIPVRRFEAPEDENSSRMLARLVNEKFAYIGQYPNVAGGFHDIADRFRLPHDRADRFNHHINSSGMGQSASHRRARFGGAFQTSYQLLSAIGVEFSDKADRT